MNTEDSLLKEGNKYLCKLQEARTHRRFQNLTFIFLNC